MELKLRKLSLKYLLPISSLIALATALVTAVVTVNLTPATQTVLIAKTPIAEGQPITSELVSQTELPIGDLASIYLSKLKPDLIAARSMTKGELLSKAGVSQVSDQRIPIRLNNLPQISKAISVGDTVDVWATPQDLANSPEAVAFRAIVVSLETTNSMAQITTSVEIRIEPEYLETLLTAVDSNYRISLILHETLSDLE
ncbi:MAG: SAF domain-containing protein [Rhodoluna sp.]|nr:SAF domain-containing protein [Rhodoluna sp.]